MKRIEIEVICLRSRIKLIRSCSEYESVLINKANPSKSNEELMFQYDFIDINKQMGINFFGELRF